MCRKPACIVSLVFVVGLVFAGVGRSADPDPVGYWKLGETSGITALDATGNGNDGTLNGDPQWVAGRLGGALEFDGDGDYVDCGDDPIFNITGPNHSRVLDKSQPVHCWLAGYLHHGR